MKKYLFIVFMYFIVNEMKAQASFNCGQFSVQSVLSDSSNGNWAISIFFEADSSAFINYPYVALMVNNQGDTLAQGGLEYFGQLGQTELTYHPNWLSEDSNFVGDIYFVYDNDTCIFTFDNAQLVDNSISWDVLNPYPNPSHGLVRWNLHDQQIEELKIYDVAGNLIVNDRYASEWLPKVEMQGVFMYQLKTRNHLYSGRILLLPR